MHKTARKAVVWLLIASLVTPVQASQLSTAMDGMFTAITVPQAISTPSMTGIAGGSFSAKFPTRNFNVIAFDPPRINAGCSGIDMYMGSFSFINDEQLKTMLRAVAQGAVGFAFKAAIRAICGSCAATLDDLQGIMDKLNAVGKNTCAIAKAIGEPVGTLLAGKADEAEAMIQVSRQKVDDWWTGQKNTASAGRSDRANKYSGNILHRALFNQDIDFSLDNEIPNLPMNLVGTYIIPAEDANAKTCAAGESGICEKPSISLEPTLNFDLLLRGASYDANKRIWKCFDSDSEMGCQNPIRVSYTFEGTKEYTKRKLFGVDGHAGSPTADSIMGKILSSGVSGLDPTQKKFLAAASSLPIASIIKRTQKHPIVRQAMLTHASELVAYDLAYKIIFQALQVTEEAFSRNTVEMPETIKLNIQATKVDIAAKGFQKSSEILQILANFENLIRRFEQIIPRAFAASSLKR